MHTVYYHTNINTPTIRPEDIQLGSFTLIRPMQSADYSQLAALWNSISGFGIRSIDDSKEGIERFLKRNPSTSVVAERGGRIVGSILCGHDGRQGSFYHVCVSSDCRNQGIGHKMTAYALQALQKEGISKVCLVAFKSNETGNAFWEKAGWTRREDFNSYEYILNQENITHFNA